MNLATARAAADRGAHVTVASSTQGRIDAALAEPPDGCVDVRGEGPGRRSVRAVGQLDHLVFMAG